MLNFNGGDHVVRSVEALTQLGWPPEQLDLVVVDNASTDGSDRRIEGRFPNVRVVRNIENSGFPANNLALRDLDGIDYVGLVNPDSFVEPGWLRALVEVLASDPRLGAVSARVLLADRFVDVEIVAPTSVPGPADRRSLGVRVSGARVDGQDRSRDVHFDDGTWGIEHDRRLGAFHWTKDRAVVRLPVAVGQRSDDPRRHQSVEAELRLSSPLGPKPVRLRCGDARVEATVGPVPTWVVVPLGGLACDIVNNVGSIVFEDGFGADRGFLEVDDGQYDQPVDVFAWCGGSVLLRPGYLADVGLFDERFFLYYEDTDLSWRGRGRGWRYRYVPGAVARHIHAASTGEASPIFQHYVERNRLLMLVKNAPLALVCRAVWRYVLVTLSYARRDIVRPLLGLRRPNVEQVRRRIASFGGFVRLLPAMLIDRRRIRRRATVGDDEIRVWLTTR